MRAKSMVLVLLSTAALGGGALLSGCANTAQDEAATTQNEAAQTRTLNLQQQRLAETRLAEPAVKQAAAKKTPAKKVASTDKTAKAKPAAPTQVAAVTNAQSVESPTEPWAIDPATGKTVGTDHWAVVRATARAEHQIARAISVQDTITDDDRDSAISLAKVGKPQDTLSTAKVDDEMGHSLGPVHAVQVNQKGVPTALEVDIGGLLGVGDRIVTVDAKHFTYLPERNIVISKMDRAELEAMLPAGKTNTEESSKADRSAEPGNQKS